MKRNILIYLFLLLMLPSCVSREYYNHSNRNDSYISYTRVTPFNYYQPMPHEQYPCRTYSRIVIDHYGRQHQIISQACLRSDKIWHDFSLER